MVTAALARAHADLHRHPLLDKPGGDFVGRTFWAWLGLALAIVVVVGAWLNMQAAGEGLADIRDQRRLDDRRAAGHADRSGRPTAPRRRRPADASARAAAAPDAPAAPRRRAAQRTPDRSATA